MQNITEYLNYIYSLERKRKKYNLKKISRLLDLFGNPHHSQEYIHIAGTNGKGGTASFLASILMEHGIKTGLFTSPHILRFNERIKINGKSIPNSYVKNFLITNHTSIKKINASFFEINTALALKYFKDKHTDIAVIETGLGGRLDATNIIEPALSIITQLGIEHTDFLGQTLKKIAEEKFGIVKPGVDVIVSDDHPELHRLFLNRVERDRISFLDEHVKLFNVSLLQQMSRFSVSFNDHDLKLILRSPLPGYYQIRNAATAILGAIKYLKESNIKFDISKAKRGINRVIINTGYHGRFESIRVNGISYIFDVAHNPEAIKNSLENLGKTKADIIIFALMNDKDYRSSVTELIKYSDKIIFTMPASKRAQKPSVLFDFAVKISELKSQYMVKKQYFCVNYVDEAVRLSKNLADNKGRILVIGSFFLIAEVIKTLKLQKMLR